MVRTITVTEEAARTVTNIEPRSKEDRQTFLRRLSDGIQKLTDEQWDQLDSKLQLWANKAATALSEKSDIPDFVDIDGQLAAKKGNGQPPKAQAATPAATGERSGVVVLTGVGVRIKELLIANPDLSAQDIIDTIIKNGGTVPTKFTVSAIRSDTRQTLKLLKNKGLLSDTIKI